MKRFLFTIILTCIINCTKDDNSVTIDNWFENEVTVNFRGRIYNVESFNTVEISGIPLGNFDFSTTVETPVWYDSTGKKSPYEREQTGDSLSGTLIFTREGTHYTLFYSGVVYEADTTYSIYFSKTSNMSGL